MSAGDGDASLSREALVLVDQCIDSVLLLEVLLFLRSESEKEWSAAEVSTCLSVEKNWVQKQLVDLQNCGLLTAGTTKLVRYRYAPATPALAGAVESLATAYKVRRVAVINRIMDRSTAHLRSFADAFRLRDRDEEGAS